MLNMWNFNFLGEYVYFWVHQLKMCLIKILLDIYFVEINFDEQPSVSSILGLPQEDTISAVINMISNCFIFIMLFSN